MGVGKGFLAARDRVVFSRRKGLGYLVTLTRWAVAPLRWLAKQCSFPAEQYAPRLYARIANLKTCMPEIIINKGVTAADTFAK
jgi:hypothetical protein